MRDSVLWQGVEVGPEATVEGSLLGPGRPRRARTRSLRGAQLGEGSVVSDYSRVPPEDAA